MLDSADHSLQKVTIQITMSPRLLTTLITLLLALSRARSACEDSQLSVGFFYSCQLTGEDFFVGADPVSFDVAVRGRAGIPEWLTLVDATNSSYLYGTPRNEDVGTLVLEITALREDATTSAEVQLTVSATEGNILQKSELYINNFDLLEFLSAKVQSDFNTTLSNVYGQLLGASPSVLQVVHPSSRGINVPLPPKKHGVIVQVTPGLNILVGTPASLMQTVCDSSFSQVFMDNGFQLETCTSMGYTIGPAQSPGTQEPTGTTDRPLPPSSGSSISLVVILVLGVVFTVMIITGLAWVCFGGRKRGFYVSHKKRVQKSTMRKVSKVTSSGPVTAQTHLRDLAQTHNKKKPECVAMEEGRPRSVTSSEALLVFQDLTDYSNPDTNSSTNSQPPLPSYTYPEGLLVGHVRNPQGH